MKRIIITTVLGIAVFLTASMDTSGEAKIIFVGDMFFDRYIRQVAERKGEDYIFSCLGSSFDEADLIVGNLEGPITQNASVSLGSEVGSPDNYIFTFPSSTAKLLSRQNIKLVNLSNNHIGNFGAEGVASTRKYLREASVGYFGGLAGDEPVFRKEINGLEFSFVSYNQFDNLMAGQFGGESVEKVADKIKEEKDAGRIVIVYAHWGEEYSAPTAHMKSAAQKFANAGASAVIGSHPHVILQKERMADTVVYYSLGNFIFDQYFSAEVSEGLVVALVFKDGGVEALETKVKLEKDGRTCIKY